MLKKGGCLLWFSLNVNLFKVRWHVDPGLFSINPDSAWTLLFHEFVCAPGVRIMWSGVNQKLILMRNSPNKMSFQVDCSQLPWTAQNTSALLKPGLHLHWFPQTTDTICCKFNSFPPKIWTKFPIGLFPKGSSRHLPKEKRACLTWGTNYGAQTTIMVWMWARWLRFSCD